MTAALEERVERLEQKVDNLANTRVAPLEVKVSRLDTWAGPGQNASLSDNLTDLRKRFDDFEKVQRRHTKALDTLASDVAGLKTDVAGLKTDMKDVKGTLSEILDRLPPRQA